MFPYDKVLCEKTRPESYTKTDGSYKNKVKKVADKKPYSIF